MNDKSILRLILLTLIFLLFAVVALPVMIHALQHPYGRWVYALLAAVSIGLAFLLRRALSELD